MMPRRCAAALLFLFAAVSVFAGGRKQKFEAFDAGDYRMDETGTYYQTIAWTSGGNGAYDVELEMQGAEGWTNIQSVSTENTSIEVSLASGNYRFRVSTYNALGKIGAVSDWTYFEVLPAKIPAAETLSPSAIYERYLGDFTLSIAGKDLAEGAEVRLVHDSGSYKAEPLSVSYDASEEKISAVFNSAKMKHGNYYAEITNPGGRKQKLYGFKADFVDVNTELLLGWAPAMPWLNEIGSSAPDVGITAGLALGGRLSVVPIGTRIGWFGIEAELANVFKPPHNKAPFGYFGALTFNLLYQYWFPGRRMAVAGRAGGGLGGVVYDAGDLAGLLNFGASYIWLPVKGETLFLEFGAEYYQPVSQPFKMFIDYDKKHGAVPGVFMVYVGMGGRY